MYRDIVFLVPGICFCFFVLFCIYGCCLFSIIMCDFCAFFTAFFRLRLRSVFWFEFFLLRITFEIYREAFTQHIDKDRGNAQIPPAHLFLSGNLQPKLAQRGCENVRGCWKNVTITPTYFSFPPLPSRPLPSPPLPSSLSTSI